MIPFHLRRSKFCGVSEKDGYEQMKKKEKRREIVKTLPVRLQTIDGGLKPSRELHFLFLFLYPDDKTEPGPISIVAAAYVEPMIKPSNYHLTEF